MEYKCQAELADSEGGPSQGHLLIQRQTQAPKSPRWKHGRGRGRESQLGSIPASLQCDSNEAGSYSMVSNLLKEYIMTYWSRFDIDQFNMSLCLTSSG